MASNIDVRMIGAKGRERFKKISEELGREYRGKFVVVEVDRGDYFIADTGVEASKKAREKYPNKVFFQGKIGYRAAVSFKGR